MVFNRYIILTIIFLQSPKSSSTTETQLPADYLKPPPAPPGEHKHFHRSVQQFQFPPLQPVPPEIYNSQSETPGIMQRVARWFGFGNGNSVNNIPPERSKEQEYQQQQQQQQLPQASYHQPQYKENPLTSPNPYQFHRPKANCNPCNKYPWVPMWPGNIPILPGHLHHQQFPPSSIGLRLPDTNSLIPTYAPVPQNIQQSLGQLSSASQHKPQFGTNQHVQRAVRFNAPGSNFQFVSPPQFHMHPIPVPNLSATPIPPLYNAAPFRQQPSGLGHNVPYIDHINQPSEIQTVFPTQIPPTDVGQSGKSNIEVQQSISLTDYVSSIEYPAKIFESPVIDLSNHQQNQHNSNYQNNQQNNSPPKLVELGTFESKPHQTSQVPLNFITPPTYQPFPSENNNNIIPVHSTLEGPNNFISESEHTFAPNNYLTPPSFEHHQNFLSDPIVVHNHDPNDNYPEASSHNLTVKDSNHLDNGNYVLAPTIFPSTLEQQQEETFFSTLIQTSTVPTRQEFYSTERSVASTLVDVIPSIQTASERPELYKKQRETPKHLLNSPILYSHNNDFYREISPKPFTRDPSELHIGNPNAKTPWQPSTSFSTTSTAKPWALEPTPTSTYSSVDASGQWAGMSPPSQFQPAPSQFDRLVDKRPKQIQQIIIPYTTRNKPRPFRAREQILSTENDSDNRYSNWSSSHEQQEFHDQEESKLVTATEVTEIPANHKKTTKYLTKILASNIRELLRKEHAVKNDSNSINSIPSGVDFNRLQKNIDDWTEQEYTSILHKASTISLNAPPKHIPNEYLTTTPTLRQPKTTFAITVTSESPSTISQRGVKSSTMLNKKDDFLAHLEDNSFFNFITNNRNRLEVYTKSYMNPNKTSSSSATTTTTYKPTTPFYIRNVKPTKSFSEKELWQKAKVSISPLTKEKVYVVTPLPRYHMRSTTPMDGIGTFKSPRFIVRPTPGINNSSNSGSNQISSSTEKSIPKPYTPELFGLMGISAFVPDVPADILDGHSRVITVVTPTPRNKKRSTDNAESRTTPRTSISSGHS